MCGGSKCARVSKGSWHSRSSADGEDVAGRGRHHGRASIGGSLAWHTCKDCVWLLGESRHPVSQTPSFLPLAPGADLPGELGPKVAEQGPGAALGQTFYVHQSQQGRNRSERARLSSQKPPVQPLQLQLPPGLARQVVEEAADRQREPPVPEAILPQGDSHPGRGHPGLHL